MILTTKRSLVLIYKSMSNKSTSLSKHGHWCESRAWRFIDVNDLVTCNVYAQRLSLWLFWRMIDQWPFQSLVNKRGKAVVPAQDWPS